MQGGEETLVRHDEPHKKERKQMKVRVNRGDVVNRTVKCLCARTSTGLMQALLLHMYTQASEQGSEETPITESGRIMKE